MAQGCSRHLGFPLCRWDRRDTCEPYRGHALRSFELSLWETQRWKPALPAAAVRPVKPPNPTGGLLSSGRWQDPKQARSSPRGLALHAAAPAPSRSAGRCSWQGRCSQQGDARGKHWRSMDEQGAGLCRHTPHARVGFWGANTALAIRCSRSPGFPTCNAAAFEARGWGCRCQEPSAPGRFPVLPSHAGEQEQEWVDGGGGQMGMGLLPCPRLQPPGQPAARHPAQRYLRGSHTSARGKAARGPRATTGRSAGASKGSGEGAGTTLG